MTLNIALIGAAFCLLFSVVTYAAGRRRRDFTTTHQVLASKPGYPASAIVGMSGASGARLAEVTARTRTFPDCMCGLVLSREEM